MRYYHDINLGRGGTRDLRRHQETKLHKTLRKRWCGCTASTVLLWANREESVIRAEVLFAYFLGEYHFAFQLGDHCTRPSELIFPDSSIAKDFKTTVSKQHTCTEPLSASSIYARNHRQQAAHMHGTTISKQHICTEPPSASSTHVRNHFSKQHTCTEPPSASSIVQSY